MATAESVKAKIQSLIDKANGATGNTDADLTAAVDALVTGFGRGESSENDLFLANLHGTLTELVSDDVTYIRSQAFREYKNLTKVSVPNCTEVASEAFYNNAELMCVEANKITSIGSAACMRCEKLTVVDFQSLLSIGQTVFKGCVSLQKLDFPSVTAMTYQNNFADCTALQTIIFRHSTVVSLGNINAFNNTPIADGTGYIYVPATLVDSYKTATNWSTYADQIRAIEEYPEITGG